MQYSTNYNMKLPEIADQYNVSHMNDNTTTLDSIIKANDDSRISGDNTLTTNLNNEITNRTEADNEIKTKSSKQGDLYDSTFNYTVGSFCTILKKIGDNIKTERFIRIDSNSTPNIPPLDNANISTVGGINQYEGGTVNSNWKYILEVSDIENGFTPYTFPQYVNQTALGTVVRYNDVPYIRMIATGNVQPFGETESTSKWQQMPSFIEAQRLFASRKIHVDSSEWHSTGTSYKVGEYSSGELHEIMMNGSAFNSTHPLYTAIQNLPASLRSAWFTLADSVYTAKDLRGKFGRATGTTNAGSVGNVGDDQMQGHGHNGNIATGSGSGSGLQTKGGSTTGEVAWTPTKLGDEYGTPRVGNETRPTFYTEGLPFIYVWKAN